ncbi:hypothetical protein [Methanococcoides sp. AM1]|uniref:hypothetical protein n=1 Tax=Methanococcoides sp. AM1 TaxID=1201011 RepID=UPI001082D076|nr:hypothetical protein [Methanococcoides sp. AM1]
MRGDETTGETIDKLVYQIKADVDEAFRGLDKVDRKMDNLEGQAGKTSTSMSKMSANIGKAMKVASVAAVAAAAAFAAFSWKAVGLASDAEEIDGKFNAVFKDNANDAKQWAEDFGDTVGRATTDVKSYMSTFQDTFVPMGFAREEGSELSKQLTELAVDLSSFNNESEPETIAALQSALVGNHETMRKYGVVITQTTLGQELMNMGIAGGVQAATEQQKVQARLNIIMKGTTDAQGDAIRTQGSFANQMRALKSDVRDLGESFGSALVPVLKEIIPVVRNALQSFLDWGNSGAFASIGEGFRQVKDAFGEIWGGLTRFATMLGPAKQAAVEAFGSIKGIIADFRQGMAGTEVDFSAIANAVNLLVIQFSNFVAFLDKYNIGEKLGKLVKSNIELYSKFYSTIVNKFIGGLNLAIEAYNKLVPLMQKAGIDAQTVNKLNFEGMTATVGEEIQKQVETAKEGSQDIQNAMGGGLGATAGGMAGSPGSGSIPGWAGHSAYIRQRLAATGGKSIDDLLATSGQPVASPVPIANPQLQPAGKSSGTKEETASILSKLDAIITVLRQEPRQVDIDMDIDIENHSDVTDFEFTLARATKAGVHGKSWVV